MRYLVVFLLAIAGCGSTVDPCDGIAGPCISASVEGTATGLDQLRISLDQLGSPRSVLTPIPAAAFTLPVRVAIIPPAATPTSFHVVVEGLGGGTTLAASAPTNVISVSPSTVTFPTQVRGTVSAPMIVTVTNNSPAARTTTSIITTGDLNSFQLDMATTTCTIVNMNMLMAPQGTSCKLGFTFQPTSSGTLTQTNVATFDDAEMGSFSLTGVATPVWSAENIAGLTGVTWRAVWGASHTGVYVVGDVPPVAGPGAPHVYFSQGNGSWGPMETGLNPSGQLFAVTGSSANDIYIGGTGGDIYHSNGNGTWTSSLSGSSDGGTFSTIRTMFAANATTVYAAGDSGTLLVGSVAGWQPQTISPAFATTIYAVTVGDLGGVRAVTDTGRILAPSSGSMWTNGVTMTNAPLTGVFFHNLMSWSVGGNGFIQRGNAGVFTVETVPVVTTFTPNLSGIAGKLDANNKLTDLYACGSLGGQLWHSTGNGAWENTSVQLPNNNAANAVFVTPDNGEIYVVHGGGQISHYY